LSTVDFRISGHVSGHGFVERFFLPPIEYGKQSNA
jgi:hypothetical protein